MKIDGLDVPGLSGVTPAASPAAPATAGRGFGDLLKEAVAEIEKIQSQSDQSVRRFAAGEDVDLHTVMLDVQKAELSFRLMLEVRNKLIEAYHEVTRMQV
ncbi:MAG TPA: flagellar hook-basal body complex protein FliE [Verrucomicrobiae bacterium]|nr:flagellar hook-basal body complex protein FliE [Verrucomicrobiae bacterium]